MKHAAPNVCRQCRTPVETKYKPVPITRRDRAARIMVSIFIGYAFQTVPDKRADPEGTKMGRRSNKAFPEPRLHPVKGLLRLRVNGREFWLGKPGTRQADERLASILAGPNVLLEIALFKIKAVIDDFV